MGVYPEDCKLRVSELVKLWVAEGFLKPNKGKSLEEVAEDCLKDLVERNLIFVSEWGSVGKMKTCGIHDLLRDLCLKEARKEMFLCVLKVHNNALTVNKGRRVVFYGERSHEIDFHQFHRALQSTPCIRSLTLFSKQSLSWQYSVPTLRLLRVLTNANALNLKGILQLINLRYLKCDLLSDAAAVLSPMCRLWCLQTLILTGHEKAIIAPNEIWEMPQLRHIISDCGIYLPDPLDGQKDGLDDFVLQNLQTLSCIKNFKCTEDILKRIPSIKKLSILNQETETSNYYLLHNISRLHKLQSLTCFFSRYTDSFKNLMFPQSLNKLTLGSCYFDWDDITTNVGSLPHLVKLKLDNCYTGAEWDTVEGKFLCLKFLQINCSNDLVSWTTDNTHFPRLERLVLKLMWKLKEIPSGFGDTLQSMELWYCGSSIISSAKEIVEEQQNLGNEGLRLTVQGDMDEVLFRLCRHE